MLVHSRAAQRFGAVQTSRWVAGRRALACGLPRPQLRRGMATANNKLAAVTLERVDEATAAWSERWKQLVEWEQAADTAASQSRIAHWSRKRLRAEGHMMVRSRLPLLIELLQRFADRPATLM